ncbi:HK97 family phage prohead protease [Pectinatus frisingensis]|uniref:HK97 family phage prohead protease n=1 Tax=Pectinatus frisingensis TaxID=865 RepID=UPI0018C73A25|nr:HK97 family phage prohead protease [Pectinatus frisingensis]
MMTQNKKIEIRAATIATTPQDNKMIVTGYAAVLEQPTIICTIGGVNYCEIVDRNAFAGTNMSDVVFRYNHSDNNFLLARTKNNTLTLSVDDKGLLMSADFADIQQGRDLYTLINRKDIDSMSFAFIVAKDSYDPQTHTRRILQFEKIIDVSAVDTPAYDATSINIDDGASISARDYFSARLEMENEVKTKDKKRKRLYLLTF